MPPRLLTGEARGFRDDPKMCEDEVFSASSNFYPEAVKALCCQELLCTLPTLVFTECLLPVELSPIEVSSCEN